MSKNQKKKTLNNENSIGPNLLIGIQRLNMCFVREAYHPLPFFLPNWKDRLKMSMLETAKCTYPTGIPVELGLREDLWQSTPSTAVDLNDGCFNSWTHENRLYGFLSRRRMHICQSADRHTPTHTHITCACTRGENENFRINFTCQAHAIMI